MILPSHFLNISTRCSASSLTRTSMLLRPIPKFFSVVSVNLRISFQRCPLVDKTPAAINNVNITFGIRFFFFNCSVIFFIVQIKHVKHQISSDLTISMSGLHQQGIGGPAAELFTKTNHCIL